MVKRLTQHGNSAALVIDKAVLELLHITMRTPLNLTTDGTRLIISPLRGGRRSARFRTAWAAGCSMLTRWTSLPRAVSPS
jgi:antitoxin component of MazEF toxin-antitoxin module